MLKLGQKAIGDALDSRDNSLNFIRLLLATSVIFWHTYPLTGVQPEWPAFLLGTWAVNGFFAISGYLIAGSRLRLEFGTFMWRRAVRIYPAFWMVLIITAFVFAPLSVLVSHRSYNVWDAVNYILQNMTLWLGELAVGDTLSGVPHHDSWNGSLWTLFFEFGAYVTAGVLLSFPFVRKHQVAVLTTVLLVLSAAVATRFGDGSLGVVDRAVPALRLWAFFVSGMLVFALRGRLRTNAAVGIVATLLFSLTWALGVQNWAGPLPFAVLLLWLGAVMTTRVGVKNDISYGMYIYAFPVQQLVVVFGFSAVAGAEWSALLAVALTVPLAYASWRFLELPLQRASRNWKPSFGPAFGAGPQRQ
ncbi:peptidoglycan/LPS O-acetylase OafA/YrhL [Pseudarthrobacter sp. W1I19]|uniref:acyltransferase family protein n=1 Tax=Pseudarthrobacter sp. W1I19 TaxID=3042288 RepID=UPI002780C385|nr:acyltransferase [Pseudarthrobacter sp. W1I19]MDQ0922283.1 peptidoglycan/LPS O-acetylase OafA/YrhL [Pseudarthrobacter sp. W1I19]